MNLKMQLRLLLEKLFQEYEERYPRMYFVFQKVEQQFVFTDVNQELLQSVHQQREDFIGQTLDTAPHLGDEETRKKLKTIYPLAWEGKKIIFYCFPISNLDILVITYLEPLYVNQQVVQVRGRCASFHKNELQDTVEQLEQFVTFEVLQ
ncbi:MULTISPECIES: hypothetical protein [Bacillus]|uniref:hypothetical protein n=1 Tax=Bacillus TaxID=1386 RepID=UPI00077AC2B5|nr:MULTISPECIES: hypothetical protein [Bacillus cereus group]KXY84375.1 hypothetical protein AT270_08290 [Bacillus cereus]MED2997293.1 hypothetical protein [Bacillus tropicus]OTY57606.1 hypothetical protein BK748_13995 [Bacillus thuringiensis serovar graciosensis]